MADVRYAWYYDRRADYKAILRPRILKIIEDLLHGHIDTRQGAMDTREIHRFMFERLTDPGFECFAGNYRGSRFPSLCDYRVRVRSDPRVGIDPSLVASEMEHLARIVDNLVARLDMAVSRPDIDLEQKLIYTIRAACKVFERFLRIHPYADGNGHASRFCMWAIMGRHGFLPYRWTIDPRPANPDYGTLISAYRSGDTYPLERAVYDCCLFPGTC